MKLDWHRGKVSKTFEGCPSDECDGNFMQDDLEEHVPLWSWIG